MSRLAIDVDGVLSDFNRAFARKLVRESGLELLPKDWKENPQFPSTWDWDDQYDQKIRWACWDAVVADTSDFWKTLDPLPQTKKALRCLHTASCAGIEIVFITNRSGKMAKRHTEEWLYEMGINYPTVILGAEKAQILRSIGATHFIDDKLATMNECVLLGLNTKRPVIQLYMPDAPYNRIGRLNGIQIVTDIWDFVQKVGLDN